MSAATAVAGMTTNVAPAKTVLHNSRDISFDLTADRQGTGRPRADAASCAGTHQPDAFPPRASPRRVIVRDTFEKYRLEKFVAGEILNSAWTQSVDFVIARGFSLARKKNL